MMVYYGCETCENNKQALLAYTDDSLDPKPIRICSETRTQLPESAVGCPKYPYAERKRIVDSCYICHKCKGKQEEVDYIKPTGWKPQWVTVQDNTMTTMVFRCKVTGEDVTEIGAAGIPASCPYLKSREGE